MCNACSFLQQKILQAGRCDLRGIAYVCYVLLRVVRYEYEPGPLYSKVGCAANRKWDGLPYLHNFLFTMISSSITTNPRKRTISEASGGVALSHQEVTHDDESGVGLRRRRVESSSTAEMDDDKDKTKNKNNSLITTQQQEGGVGEQSHNNDHQQQQSVVPLSMQLMRPFWAISCCPDCPRSTTSYNYNTRNSSASFSNQDFFTGKNNNNNLDHTLPTPTGPTRNISMAQINDVERNERHRRAVGDMASIDAVRIAIGKKVFRDKCALAFQLGTKSPYIQFSFEHKGKLSEHRVYLKSEEVKEVKYHIPHEKETGEGEIDSDSMTMIAFRISPNDKNNLEKYSNSYNQEDSDDDSEKAHKRYIAVEIRDTDEFYVSISCFGKNYVTLLYS